MYLHLYRMQNTIRPTPYLCLPQVKVMTEHDLLAVACEQFLGKSVMEIKAVVLQTLEGHLRSILGTDMRHI